ncbi:MAG: radical SAM protein, partial [Thermoleophilia bacterium]|nr:radical SAM protein [Thermoleophilia bacterium]
MAGDAFSGGEIPAAGSLLQLTPDCSPKLLEEPCVYNRSTDDLYILNSEAVGFLAECASGAVAPEGAEAAEFVKFCLEERILQPATELSERELHLKQSPLPSLRYLLLHITDRCNLRCRHCFIGECGSANLPLEKIMAVVDEFEGMQGLRLLISGGEPLLHRDFWKLNEYIADRDLRTVLLSNGTLIDDETAGRLRVQEVQVSLDGMAIAHDYLRGEGNFALSVAGIERLTAAGIQVSVATMVHSRNLDDFEQLEQLVKDLGAREWAVDLPSAAGRLEKESGLMVDPAIAGPYLNLSFGGAIHEPVAGYACGAHLMAVMADGSVARCGFYADQPVGSISEGLAACWQRIGKIPLAELECDCEFLEDCRGGCRFRATGYYNRVRGPDLCQCYRYGV